MKKRSLPKRMKGLKSERFLDEVKHSFTDLMNVYVGNDEEKLNVFQHGSVYLPTKKSVRTTLRKQKSGQIM